MRTIFSLLFIILSTNISIAQNEKSKMYSGAGFGTVSCYDFLHPAEGKELSNREAIFFTWAQGFMTGKNATSAEDVDLFALDVDEQKSIIKIYCEKHKRDSFTYASDFLYYVLDKATKEKYKK